MRPYPETSGLLLLILHTHTHTHGGQEAERDGEVLLEAHERSSAQIQSLLYLTDAFVDVVKIDEYAYYMNTMDDVYRVWQGHPKAQFGFRPADDFNPLATYPNPDDVQAHQAATQSPLIFAICHF
jgi:hypothetical protein